MPEPLHAETMARRNHIACMQDSIVHACMYTHMHACSRLQISECMCALDCIIMTPELYNNVMIPDNNYIAIYS